MLNLEIAASILNLPLRTVVSGSADTQVTALHGAGYEHMQYVPARNIHPAIGRAVLASGVVTSLHQSFLYFDRHSRSANYVMYAGLPTLQASMPRLANLEAGVTPPRSLPIVVHPEGQHLDHRAAKPGYDYAMLSKRHRYGPFIHQPTLELLKLWGILGQNGLKVADDMLEVQAAKGFAGVALDLHHLTVERGGIEPTDMREGWHEAFVGELAACGALGGPSEVQVSLRSDYGGNVQDMRSVLDGEWLATPHGRLLAAIHDALPAEQTSLRLTTEVRASAWKALKLDWQEGNRRLIQSLQVSPIAG